MGEKGKQEKRKKRKEKTMKEKEIQNERNPEILPFNLMGLKDN